MRPYLEMSIKNVKQATRTQDPGGVEEYLTPFCLVIELKE